MNVIFMMKSGGKSVGCELLIPLGDKENLFAEILLEDMKFYWVVLCLLYTVLFLLALIFLM